MSVPTDVAIPVPVHFDGHNINIITEVNFPNTPTPVKQSSSPNKDRQSLYKTELCREWSTSGWCYYGKRCSFAHGLNELRPVFRSKKWRTKRCRNWQSTGYCPYEHRCQFLHDQSPPRRVFDEDSKQAEGTTTPTNTSPTRGGDDAGGDTTSTTATTTATSKLDGSKDLYFHFEVREGGDAEEDESDVVTLDSENEDDDNRRPTRVRRKILTDLSPNNLEGVTKSKRRKRRKNHGAALSSSLPTSSSSPSVSVSTSPPSNPVVHQHQRQPGSLSPPVTTPPLGMNMMQAHQILSNQTAATQLAAQFNSMHLAAAAQQPQLYGDAGARMTATTPAAQFAAARARLHGGDMASASPSPDLSGGGGLAGGPTPVEDTSALLSAMCSMGPTLMPELLYAAQLGQLPRAELDQLCSMYPMSGGVGGVNGNLTAPVPFTSAPPHLGGGGGSGVVPPGATVAAFDGSVVGTPSGSVEPPGFDRAFYPPPTPSPPPSAFGVDSVSNLGLRFVPSDSPAPPFGLQYQAGMNTPISMDGRTQFLFPTCTTPTLPFTNNAAAANMFSRPMTPVGTPPMTPTGMYGGATFPSYFAGQPSAFAAGMAAATGAGLAGGQQQPQPVVPPNTGSTGLAGGPDPNGIVLFGGPPSSSFPGVISLDGSSVPSAAASVSSSRRS